MRVVICGDRNYKKEAPIEAWLYGLYAIYAGDLYVINGDAPGADSIAKKHAELILHKDRVLTFPADWKKYGNAAGPKRNTEMLDKGQPDLVIAFHDHIEDSKGTKNMLQQADSRMIPTYLVSTWPLKG